MLKKLRKLSAGDLRPKKIYISVENAIYLRTKCYVCYIGLPLIVSGEHGILTFLKCVCKTWELKKVFLRKCQERFDRGVRTFSLVFLFNNPPPTVRADTDSEDKNRAAKAMKKRKILEKHMHNVLISCLRPNFSLFDTDEDDKITFKCPLLYCRDNPDKNVHLQPNPLPHCPLLSALLLAPPFPKAPTSSMDAPYWNREKVKKVSLLALKNLSYKMKTRALCRMWVAKEMGIND